MTNELYINGTLIKSINDFNSQKIQSDVKIKCNNCNIFFTFKIKKLHYFNEKFVCRSCFSSGTNNPFYGKSHSEFFKDKLKKERSGTWYVNEKNSMFGKTNYDVWLEKYGKEIADEKQKKSNEKNRISNSGTNNPFYGKTHTNEVKDSIREKLQLYRDRNKNFLIQKGMSSLNLTDEKLTEILNDYKNNPNNSRSIQEKYKYDFRTIESYLIKRNIITKEEFKKIKRNKKFLGNRDLSKLVSKPEFDVFNKLKKLYGTENVKQCFVIKNTCVVYDICLFNKILIEYDGFYWHKIKNGKNDVYKTKLAEESGYILYRIEEDENRKIDLDEELKNIKYLLLKENLIN